MTQYVNGLRHSKKPPIVRSTTAVSLWLIGLLMILVLGGNYVHSQLKSSLESAFQQRTEGILHSLESMSEHSIVSFDLPILEELHRRTLADPMVLDLWIENLLSEQTIGQEKQGGEIHGKLYSKPIDYENEIVGRIHLVIDETELLATLAWLRNFLFITNAAILIVIGSICYMLFRARAQTVLIQHEIIERVRVEEELRKISAAVEQSPVTVIISDPNGIIQYVNPKFIDVTGFKREEVIGQNTSILKSGNTPHAVYQDLWATVTAGGTWSGDFQSLRKNGETFWEQASISPIRAADGTITHYLAIKEDVTLRKEQEEQILYQAHFDSLTSLPNRFLTLDRLSQLISEAVRTEEQVAVLFVDLDDFKKINDTLGHEAGDQVLIEAAQRLRDAVRDKDTVGRLGGDEFVILIGGLTNTTDARPVAESLLEGFRDAFRINDRELLLTPSIGIAVYPDDGESSSELLRKADSAMYHSKELGRNTYTYFTDSMNQEVFRRLALEEQMHGALDRDEFRVCYQPQIDVVSGRIIGVEALLRWSNSTLGEVSPVEFIPIAEQIGLIIPIGKFVLCEALGMVHSWQQKCDQPFTMAVNLSPRQFRDPNLVSFIEDAIRQSGVTGESLELEITEGVLMSGHADIDNALSALSGLGVSLTMDDFGTGYSSLSYLRSYPFDILKIDRSFVNDIMVDPADRELVNATIAMAHGLGLKVVAEGVETEPQLALLAAQRCDIAQGYLFSKPVSAEEITKMLERAEPIIRRPLSVH